MVLAAIPLAARRPALFAAHRKIDVSDHDPGAELARRPGAVRPIPCPPPVTTATRPSNPLFPVESEQIATDSSWIRFYRFTKSFKRCRISIRLEGTEGLPIKRATIKDVAIRAGVSAATVSNVMLGRNAATREVADRVREAARTLGYVADRSASQLRSGKTRIITILVPNLTDPFFAAVIAELEQRAQAENYDIVVASSNANEDVERTRLSALLSWRPSGVVVVPHRDDFPNRSMLDDLQLPYVVVDRAASDLPADAVVTANHAATAEAAAHLLDNGHRDVLVVTSTFRLENIRQRIQGVVDRFAERGLPAPPSLEVGLNFETVAERMAAWLAENNRAVLRRRLCHDPGRPGGLDDGGDALRLPPGLPVFPGRRGLRGRRAHPHGQHRGDDLRGQTAPRGGTCLTFGFETRRSSLRRSDSFSSPPLRLSGWRWGRSRARPALSPSRPCGPTSTISTISPRCCGTISPFC